MLLHLSPFLLPRIYISTWGQKKAANKSTPSHHLLYLSDSEPGRELSTKEYSGEESTASTAATVLSECHSDNMSKMIAMFMQMQKDDSKERKLEAIYYRKLEDERRREE